MALVDLNAILSQASMTGIAFDDYTLNTDLVFGGLISFDGVHLTARGYALWQINSWKLQMLTLIPTL